MSGLGLRGGFSYGKRCLCPKCVLLIGNAMVLLFVKRLRSGLAVELNYAIIINIDSNFKSPVGCATIQLL